MISYLSSPIGTLCMEGENFVERLYPAPYHAPLLSNDLAYRCQTQLNEYFAGIRKDFTLPLSPGGTDFQKKVWAILRDIPFGSTLSYGEVAKKLGDARYARAVGQAVGKNPVMIIIPCHRVLSKNGLGGFAYGLEIKKELLSVENIEFSLATWYSNPIGENYD